MKWPLATDVTDADLAKQLLGDHGSDPARAPPHREKIRRELPRKDVTRILLKTEDCEEQEWIERTLRCIPAHDRFRDFMNLGRSTMHIIKNPANALRSTRLAKCSISPTATGES